MKTMMVKRLESSFHAFKKTLYNLMVSTQRMIGMYNDDKIFIAPDLDINELFEQGHSSEEIEAVISNLNLENPKNNVFNAADFDPEFIAGLQKDYDLLKTLHNDWSQVDEDPKLEKFLKTVDSQLFSPDINPSGTLVVFTESNDTANYLEEQLKKHTDKGILKVSSGNRKKIFDIIQQNFDANYQGKQKNDYRILITTDVLSEGVNLHRANVLVNYDTPWNATRLMQRLGRINRIGSVSGVIHNYIFYPSKQGDEEIKLYQNALVKLQSFHTAFGADTQVFTHEELIEKFELFKEGMPDDEDKRLIYLRLIREFKDSNPSEFRRIKKLPLKARTGRANAVLKDKTLANGTIVFLKSPYKMDFYAVTDHGVKALTFLEAAETFEARDSEPGAAIPDFHFDHVKKAMDKFEEDFFSSSASTVTSTDKTDAISAQAKKFLRDFKGFQPDKKLKRAATALIALIDKGTYTPLPNEIRKLKRKIDKREVTLGQATHLILAIAKKYDALADTVTETGQTGLKPDAAFRPKIVITETFWK